MLQAKRDSLIFEPVRQCSIRVTPDYSFYYLSTTLKGHLD